MRICWQNPLMVKQDYLLHSLLYLYYTSILPWISELISKGSIGINDYRASEENGSLKKGRINMFLV